MFMEIRRRAILQPSKPDEHGSALRGRALLLETLIEAMRIMVRSGAVDDTLRRVMQREGCTEVEL